MKNVNAGKEETLLRKGKKSPRVRIYRDVAAVVWGTVLKRAVRILGMGFNMRREILFFWKRKGGTITW